MTQTTLDACRALISADSTLSLSDRRAIMEAVRQAGKPPPVAPPPPRIISRAETAQLLNRSSRAVDYLASQGHLKKVRMPGRQRCCGFRLADIENLINATAQ